ncbi:PilZ domain-containing protein [Neisseria animalis]|uniref:Pilus assembly protein n=1 Tax=Neisseria animalis TaxID=492 RepID=A0A5P3MS34_NEIAN|nr:pilus assembly protein [Neisseria animalis]QEY23449.1 pilus assembly protein [Neisseria animalis]ROW33294.1 pilus assembly protein [Neisseria animalis]VEE08963.1 type 4 pilus biogenesis protein [Neisseria animalis]
MTDNDFPLKTLVLRIRDKTMLYQCYMPFLVNGGLFVPTDDILSLGQNVLLTVEIGNRRFQDLPVKTAWISPAGMSAQRPRGVGLAFGSNEDCRRLKQLIETELGDEIRSERTTFTL